MLSMKQTSIGFVLILISIILLFVLTFIKQEFEERETFLCTAVEASPALNMDDCPVHSSNLSWLLIVGFIGSILIFIVGVVLFIIKPGFFATKTEMEKQGEKQTDTKASHASRHFDLSKLSEEEKCIVAILQKDDGAQYQSNVIKETGFTKVKITRILDKLEGKGIIERKRRGMTNIIILR